MVSVSALVVPGGELGVLVGVGDAAERGGVVEAAVEHLVHDLARLLVADLPDGEDGAQGAAPDALLGDGGDGGDGGDCGGRWGGWDKLSQVRTVNKYCTKQP